MSLRFRLGAATVGKSGLRVNVGKRRGALRGFGSVPLTAGSATHRAKPVGNVRLWRLSKWFR
jgi:hypothetical protein